MGNGNRKSKIVIIAALVALPIFFSCKKKSSALPAARAPGDEIRALFVTLTAKPTRLSFCGCNR